MVQVAVSEFRGHLNKYLKAVQQGETLVLTSRNRVIAKITAPDNQKASVQEKLLELRETAQIGDVLSGTGENWKASE